MQYFYINANSLNPSLRVAVIDDGRFDFAKFHEGIQDAVVTFSMRDKETGLLKVSKQKADILLSEDEGCSDRYILAYRWKKRDVKERGNYKAWFEIVFNGNLTKEGSTYPTGNLIVPIKDDLEVVVR